jgi:hypothetical protein
LHGPRRVSFPIQRLSQPSHPVTALFSHSLPRSFCAAQRSFLRLSTYRLHLIESQCTVHFINASRVPATMLVVEIAALIAGSP